MKLKHRIIIFFFSLLSFNSFAAHIIGGEIYYDYLGADNYQITLKLYRDCFSGGAEFDDSIPIFVLNSAGDSITSVNVPLPGSTLLPITLDNPCFIPPTDICVQQAIYQTILNLPGIPPGGYDIVFQRCCRNGSILNLVDPSNQGITCTVHIPDNAAAPGGNSSVRFSEFPPIFLCLGVPLTFDHSATDPDGDSLYYELCDPYVGLDAFCPTIGTFGCPSSPPPPPYSFVSWATGYSASYPIDALPAFTIDPVTGLMTGTPTMIGRYVVGVCVSEYRGGVLLDVDKRDFQFNVIACAGIPVASIPIEADYPPETHFCIGYTLYFSQSSLNATTYHWDFGEPSITTDTSDLESPSWTYSDSGTYVVTLIINPGTLCSDTNSNTFHVYPLLDPQFTPSEACFENNNLNFMAGGAFTGSGTFSWNFSSHGTPNLSSDQNPAHVIFDTAGVFPVTLTINENGCTRSYTDSVRIHSDPIANYGLQSSITCEMEPVYFTDSSQADAALTYQWTFGDGGSSSLQNPSHTYGSSGTYSTSLIITTLYGCKDTAVLPMTLIHYPKPEAGFTITPRDTTISYSNITSFDQSVDAISCSINWGDGTIDTTCNIVHHYTHLGVYDVMQIVKNSAGCTDTAYSRVTISPEYLFWMPNAFTPNNDGINDEFKPVLKGVHNYSFTIFDRWGEKLFQTDDPTIGWGGFYGSKSCINDTYIYKINFKDDELLLDHQFIGSLTLTR